MSVSEVVEDVSMAVNAAVDAASGWCSEAFAEAAAVDVGVGGVDDGDEVGGLDVMSVVMCIAVDGGGDSEVKSAP